MKLSFLLFRSTLRCSQQAGGGSGQYIAREIIGNVILFIPLGQLLTTIFRGKYLPLITVFGFVASLAIETTQYCYGLGTFEVADLIHNTLGAVCGYYIYKTDFYLKGQNCGIISEVASCGVK